jgi:hypothetical protein
MVKTLVAVAGKTPAALSTPPGGEPITVSRPPFANVVAVALVKSVTELVDAS